MHQQELLQDLVVEVVAIDRGIDRHACVCEGIEHLHEPLFRGIGAIARRTIAGVEDGHAWPCVGVHVGPRIPR